MTDKQDKELVQANEGIAGKTFQSSDYKSNSDVSTGFAVTHEQIGDTYFEGTIDKQDAAENRTSQDH